MQTESLSRKAAEYRAIMSEYDIVTKCVEEKDFSYVREIFEHGFKGYINFTDEELEKELEAQYGRKFKIIEKQEN